jgi:DNA-binding SARP family transcriptional activator
VLRALTFGQCAFESPLARIAPDSEIHFALLLSLAASPPEGVPRDELVARIWPRAEGEEGRHRMRQAMYRLRQLTIPIQLRGGHLSLDWPQTDLDVHLLLHGAPRREALVRLGALPFLPSYAPMLGEPFGHWLESLRARVAMRLRRALADEVSSARGRGRFHEMGQVARALLALDPLNEIGTMGLAEALALEGSKVEALRLLEDYEDEVGAINVNLQLPVRVLRRRVAEVLDDSLMLRRFEIPFVGREREFGELRQLLREVRGGASRAAIITGEAGIGKSRLAGELLRLAALDGATLASYTASTGDSFTPISTLVSVGQQLLTLPGALGCAQEHLAYVRRLGTPETVTAWSVTGMAADILYAQLVQALAELVSAIAEEAPLLLLVDDAERLHPTTWRVLMDVWDRVGARSACFLFAARRLPEWYGSAGPRSCERLMQHVRLFPFRREESLEFVQRWGEKNHVAVDDDAAQRVAATSQGNPFYLTELAAHLGRGGDPVETPPSIRELIAAQHAALSKRAQRVLLVIALFEARATTSRVTQVLELPAGEFMAALDELEEAGLVGAKGPTVWCRHRLVGEMSASLGMPSIVAFAHGRSAALLEAEADATNSVELLGDCVTHWERAGETRRAYEAAMKLGHRLVGMGMGEEAGKAFERAENLSEESADKLRAVEGRIVALRLSAKWFAVADAYDRRRVLRRETSSEPDLRDEHYLIALESSIWSNDPRHDVADAINLAADRSNSDGLRVKAALLAAMYSDNCYSARGIRKAVAAVADIAEPPDDDGSTSTLRLVYHCAIGEIASVAALANQLASVSANAEASWLRVQGMRRAAIGYLRAGDAVSAEVALLRVLELTEKLRLPHQGYATRELLFDSCIAQGAHTRAEAHLDAMIAANLGTTAGYLQLMRLSAETRLAWSLKNAEMVAHIESGAFSQTPHTIPYLSHNMLTNELALSLLRDQRESARQYLSPLIDLHLKSRSMGRQDYCAEVLFAALRLLGRHRIAGRLAGEYYTIHRREVRSTLWNTSGVEF